MEKAKALLKDFGARDGHHETTVDETVAPAVVHEKVRRVEQEQVVPAVDKEVHQHHYHTSVQPVADREVLPEEHHHKAIAVEHREIDHSDAERTRLRLEQEAAQFADRREEVGTEHTRSVLPVITGEHRHHHIHETIQPIVQKETVQPVVVHTTVPVHEIIHNEAQHHTASALPAMSLADFQAKGGVLDGRDALTREGFEGEPRAFSDSTAGQDSTVAGGMGSSGYDNTSSSGGLRGSSSTGMGTTTGSSGLSGRETRNY